MPTLKQAALFAALTGLRYCDLRQLRWSSVHYGEEVGYQLRFRQQKTGSVETMPLSEAAYGLLRERPAEDTLLFAGLPLALGNSANAYIKAWVKAAGIEKHITFHCFRHSFATLQLTLGVDIYTVSKLLGHKEVKTTQIYGRIVDEKKRSAAERLGAVWQEAVAGSMQGNA